MIGITKSILSLCILLYFPVCWVVNVIQFTDCDFEANPSLKCEIVHGLGIVPIISGVTVWINTTENK